MADSLMTVDELITAMSAMRDGQVKMTDDQLARVYTLALEMAGKGVADFSQPGNPLSAVL